MKSLAMHTGNEGGNGEVFPLSFDCGRGKCDKLGGRKEYLVELMSIFEEYFTESGHPIMSKGERNRKLLH